MGSYPFPRYEPNTTIADLLLRSGQQRADMQLRRSDILAGTIGQLGQIPLQLERQKALAAETQLRQAEGRRAEAQATREEQETRRQAGEREVLGSAYAGSSPDVVMRHLDATGYGYLKPQAMKALTESQAEMESFKQIATDHIAGEIFRTVVPVIDKPELAMPAMHIAAKNLIDSGIDSQRVSQIVGQIEQNPQSLPQYVQAIIGSSEKVSKKYKESLGQTITVGGQILKPGVGATPPTPIYTAPPTPEQQAKLAEEVRHNRATERIQEFAATGGMPIPAQGAQAAVPPAGQSASAGEDFLKTLSPQIATQVKAYAEGRMPIPSGFALKSPYFQAMMRQVAQYDPTFDAANYPARAAARRDFTSGASAKSINALNTVIGHLGDLSEKVDALGATDAPALNAVRNWLKTQTGSSDVTNFNTVKKGVTDELTRVWRQAGGAEADIKTWAENLNAAGSNEQLNGGLATIGGMLESKLNAFENQKQQALGEGGKNINIITPEARKTLDQIEKKTKPEQPPIAGAQQFRNPQTGEVAWWVKKDGQWVKQ